ncbi:MAG: hypothetical protein US42_C0008G0020 [Candidatus Magasanikbacteria bacterium GW2011_GWC2_37_14]|uniref:Uncharacterized protein n=1 Tax=Candidatus Magasanikbacteria bacterium GW2011_GWC2_37_14 TaxID=1619046 RepID=A0A0G0ITK5_9BACT|nr:MAG: hypothetical protein US42_C0008G0020 [Candidatus Magasanikbacteria bacterium GW2011_GWC2_37_14]
MPYENLKTMQNFTLKNLPNLDVTVLGALELFIKEGVPKLNLGNYKKPLVIGSGNGAVTGKILFAGQEVVLADESNYQIKLKNIKNIDGAIIISASGSKHAITLAKDFKKRKIATKLLTNNLYAPAKKYIAPNNFFVLPKNKEPYTYNTSTYLGMILGQTKEDPRKIKDFILNTIQKQIPKNFKKYDSFYLIVPNEFEVTRELFVTKFDELFEPVVSGRVFTPEQSKHAKSVANNSKELFISFGYDNKLFGQKNNRLNISLPKNSNYATVMAIVYYVIGKIQEQHAPYFKKGIAKYCQNASKVFGYEIKPIVE